MNKPMLSLIGILLCVVNFVILASAASAFFVSMFGKNLGALLLIASVAGAYLGTALFCYALLGESRYRKGL